MWLNISMRKQAIFVNESRASYLGGVDKQQVVMIRAVVLCVTISHNEAMEINDQAA